MGSATLVAVVFICEALAILALLSENGVLCNERHGVSRKVHTQQRRDLAMSLLLLDVARFGSSRPFHPAIVTAKTGLPRFLVRPPLDLRLARYRSLVLQSSPVEQTANSTPEDVSLDLEASSGKSVKNDSVIFEDIILNPEDDWEDAIEDVDPLIQRQKDEMYKEAAKESIASESNESILADNLTDVVGEYTSGEFVDAKNDHPTTPVLQSSPEQQVEQITNSTPGDANLDLDTSSEQGVENKSVIFKFEDIILNLEDKVDDNVEDDEIAFEDPLIQRQKDEMNKEAAKDDLNKEAANETMVREANESSHVDSGIHGVIGEIVGAKEDPPSANKSSSEGGGSALEQKSGKRYEALLGAIQPSSVTQKDAVTVESEHKRENAQIVEPHSREEQHKNATTEQAVDPVKEVQVRKEELDSKALQRNWFGYETSGTFTPAYESTLRYETADWMKNFGKGTLTLRRIRSPLLFNCLVTLATCIVNQFFGPVRALPALPHQLSGSVLSLLLVFRNNNAYTRFWEARTQWGKVTNECRELAALSISFMSPKQALPMLALISLYPHVMMNYLQGERDTQMVKRLVNEQEAEALKQVLNQPLYVLSRMQMLAFDSVKAGVDVKYRDNVMPRLYNLRETVSNCERIFNTPIPLAYSGHLSRFVTIYLGTLPLVLITSLGWSSLPVMVVLCWALLGIQEIGNTIEFPFSAIDEETGRALLPMSEICRTIRRDVRATAAAQQIAQKYNAPTITKSPNVLNLPEGLREIFQMFDQNSNKQGPSDGGKKNATRL